MTYPARVPAVVLYSGDTTDDTWPSYQFKDEQGDPEDLSAYTWKAQWRKTPSSTTFVELTVGTASAATGILTISATASQTATFTDKGSWDLQSTDGAVIRTWIYGDVYCTKDVTRAS